MPRRPSGNALANNCLSARHGPSTQAATPLFHCRELGGHTGHVNTIEFSDDEALLISGGADKSVRLRSFSTEDRERVTCAEMETKHQNSVLCLALSDNHIFSGGSDNTLFIHDSHT